LFGQNRKIYPHPQIDITGNCKRNGWIWSY